LKRQVRVILDQAKLEAHGITPLQIAHQIQTANQAAHRGERPELNTEYIVGSEGSSRTRRTSRVSSSPCRESPRLFFATSPRSSTVRRRSATTSPRVGPSFHETGAESAEEYQAVTLGVAKRKGSDAMRVANQVMKKIEALEGA